ncbi:MAG: hypothetical protein JXA71_04570 [Chitinispirillaceae bacterium]|nr:hypothetical protein [Chitinispirillaceae bacterium]
MSSRVRHCLGVMVTIVCATGGFAQGRTQPDVHSIAQRTTVLIAKGDSYLENAVTTMIVEKLSGRAITVVTVDLKTLSTTVPAEYGAVVVFNAVKSSRLNRSVRKFLHRFTATNRSLESNMLICTVHGNLWNSENSTVDAVAGATKTLDPPVVANRIVKRIDEVLAAIEIPGRE